LRASCMVASRIKEVDFLPESHVSDLCTKILPSFQTPTH
jgi:hypothetical protein